jgi:hypothetical protein
LFAPVVLPGNELAIPAHQRIRRYDIGHLLERLAIKGFGLASQADSLRIRESQSLLPKLLKEKSVLVD